MSIYTSKTIGVTNINCFSISPMRNINSRNSFIRGHDERNAVNMPVQGSAADIIKLAMINVDQWLQSKQLKSRMIMQVHDELVLEVPGNEFKQVVVGVTECMESAASLQVKLVVDVGDGNNWDEAH